LARRRLPLILAADNPPPRPQLSELRPWRFVSGGAASTRPAAIEIDKPITAIPDRNPECIPARSLDPTR
jgi:hypothetical protein